MVAWTTRPLDQMLWSKSHGLWGSESIRFSNWMELILYLFSTYSAWGPFTFIHDRILYVWPSESFLNVIPNVLEAVKYERFLSGEVLLNFNSMNVKIIFDEIPTLKNCSKTSKTFSGNFETHKKRFLGDNKRCQSSSPNPAKNCSAKYWISKS